MKAGNKHGQMETSGSGSGINAEIKDLENILNSNLSWTYESPATNEVTIFSGIFLAILLVAGLVLNALVVITILVTDSLRRKAFNVFIVSLALSDMVSSLFSPLGWYKQTLGFEEFKLPEFLCKLFWALDFSTSICTSLTIASYTLVRYICITKNQLGAMEIVNVKVAVIWITILWLTSCAGGGFIGFVNFVITKPDRYSGLGTAKASSCGAQMSRWLKPSSIGLMFILTVTGCIILVFTVMIFLSLKKTELEVRNSPALNEHHVNVRLGQISTIRANLMMVVIGYVLGYYPLIAATFVAIFVSGDSSTIIEIHYWLSFAGYLCTRISECLNPILYNILSSSMRRACKSVVGKSVRYLSSGVTQRSKVHSSGNTSTTNSH